MKELLKRSRKLAQFLSDYSIGSIKLQADQLIKDIDKFLEDEYIYGDKVS